VAAVKFRELFHRCLCRQWTLMLQATGLRHGTRAVACWAVGLLPARPRACGGRAGLPGSCVAWHKRNKAGLKLGALLNTIQGLLLTTYHAHTQSHTQSHTHTHTHTHTQGCAMGPPMWPWHCGLIARSVSGVEWDDFLLVFPLLTCGYC